MEFVDGPQVKMSGMKSMSVRAGSKAVYAASIDRRTGYGSYSGLNFASASATLPMMRGHDRRATEPVYAR
ncbi:uncharacterized protein L969DRAFT_67392 [Mixia osmundae IAM 14324]|uniref:Uncharacterized protein n=1 Tax=Mixia osmundae (strain CBS 9802 / IAM 14324 / JCM 22182 / KY 12970) TaxID=764103 RepID=G7DW67_MIXOS|nr:uncharacterized protein L969DRAFT_67392 [Mixia osmundae IAM 14324]KEI36430.1 hypothetical protein L969DRAFT_67392 [Mixia osmundae IAM 14324]GAA94873.1 hypothetical protein E5Q_01527 [Mixia osmundae IAM 14324]